ncbi:MULTISPECIES: hypothetical protein [Aeromonas]|uniref:hypothetical protein n=1 Tax=Aeromonas TaxID=642 RepID=UPI0028580146|nr:hypothetical protein [Aeromonas salmonicida]MDR7021057.1 hypothetical protein [Aeromonas salmonicida]WVM47182.1 hypothetical protein V0242_09180 [Aeromonas hydrophila]
MKSIQYTELTSKVRNQLTGLVSGLDNSIYHAFNDFLDAIQIQDNRKLLADDCNALLQTQENKLYDENITVENMLRYGNKNSIFSFYTIPGLYKDLPCLKKTSLDKRIVDFYHLTDMFTGVIKNLVIPVLNEYGAASDKLEVVSKVWKHTNSDDVFANNESFVPVHFDRSVLTIMLDNNIDNVSESNNLYIAPTNNEPFDINAIYKGLKLSNCYFPSKRDYPLVIAGLHAKEYIDLYPVPHGVTPVNKSTGEYRYSLLAFVVPKDGLYCTYKALPGDTSDRLS